MAARPRKSVTSTLKRWNSGWGGESKIPFRGINAFPWMISALGTESRIKTVFMTDAKGNSLLKGDSTSLKIYRGVATSTKAPKHPKDLLLCTQSNPAPLSNPGWLGQIKQRQKRLQ